MSDIKEKQFSIDHSSKSSNRRISTMSEKNVDLDKNGSSSSPSSPTVTKFTIRRSIETNPSNEIVDYEVVDSENITNSIGKNDKIHSRGDSPMESETINNGLVPMEIDLISSTTLELSSNISENENDLESQSEIIPASSSSITPSMKPVAVSSPLTLLKDDSSNNIIATAIPKMTREMRNLQQSTNESKVLSDYLNTSDSPRRSRKAKENQTVTHELDMTPVENTSTIPLTTTVLAMADKEIPLKDENDSDSTVLVNDDVGKKRRKSFSRSRTASRARSISKNRSKSMQRMLNDEMTTASDKDDNNEEDDNDMGDSSMFTKPVENRAPNPPPKPGYDSFCFKCHMDTAVLSLACKNCKSSYHRHCARILGTIIPKNPDEFVCNECLEIEKATRSPTNKYHHPKIDMHTLKEMLTTILEKIRTYPDRECYENEIQFLKTTKDTNQPLIITQISLRMIEERIMNSYYKVSESFMHDIRQLEHNWTIIDRNKIKSMKLILKFVSSEINEMEACVHCYSSSFVVSNWFTAPCKRPHLLIWAKLKGYPYWPAKVMSVMQEHADVRFFGAHDRANVPVSHCLIFSDKDPNKSGKTPSNKGASKTQKGIADAMKEKDEYIQNVSERYGFRYATTREILDSNLMQKQLEAQLPGLKKDNREYDKSDFDGNQKEKLTLKIVKTPDGTQTIEQRTPKITDKDRHPLYRVLSKNEDNSENSDQSRVKAIILKRNIQGDSEKEKSKHSRSRVDDSVSETSESNLSSRESSIVSMRRKSIRDPTPKRRKSEKNVDESSSSPSSSRKKQKNVENVNAEMDAPKKIRRKSTLGDDESDKSAPLIVSVNAPKIPPGTNQVISLRDDENEIDNNIIKISKPRTLQRSRSFNKTSTTNDKTNKRRLSTSSTPADFSRNDLLSVKIIQPKPLSQKSISRSSLKRPSTPRVINQKVDQNKKRSSINLELDPEIIIKAEPLSDEEEVVQRNKITMDDYADLVSGESSVKRRTILITSDNSNDSFQNQVSRARKSFPKPTIRNRSDALQTNAAMICIPPNDFSPTNELSVQQQQQHDTIVPLNQSPQPNRIINGAAAVTQVETGNNNGPTTSHSSQINNNGSSLSRSSSRHNSTNDRGIINRTVQSPNRDGNLPRLLPKPTGVFSNEGNTFQRESGAVAALFNENAHRMTDYFKSLLIDTIGAISNGVSDAQNVMLKLELEKTKQQMNNMKIEHQMKIDKLRKDHADEIKLLKDAHDEKIKNINKAHNEDKFLLISDIRQQCEVEKQRAIEATRRETKKMTWCSNCTKEARFYCCWNTSYCGPTCQKNHWQQHLKYCTNRNSTAAATSTATSSSAISSPTVDQQNLNKQQNVTNNDSNILQSTTVAVSSSSAVPVPVSISNFPTNINSNNNRQLIQAFASFSKHTSPHTQQQQQQQPSQPQPQQQHSLSVDSFLRKPQTIIETTRSQQIIHTILPNSFFPQQQQHHQQQQQQQHLKLPVKPPSAPTEQITTLTPNNLVIRTLPRNNSPQITVISNARTNINEILSTSNPQQPATTITKTIQNSPGMIVTNSSKPIDMAKLPHK